MLEKVPALIAKKITDQLHIPVIGIGAGNGCDGQVLVMHDLLGLNPAFKPKFVRKYADLFTIVTDAVKNYIEDVKRKDFPNEQESY